MTESRVAELYRRFGPVIYSRCNFMLANDAEAADATQEVFVRVLRYIDRAPVTDEALFWIHRMATNHCLNELRGRSRRPNTSAHGDTVIPSSLDLESALSNRDLATRLIGAAPVKVQSTAWMYWVDGYEQEEIAELSGISRRTVANYLARFLTSAQGFLRRTA